TEIVMDLECLTPSVINIELNQKSVTGLRMQLTMNSKLSLTLGMVSGAVLGKLAWDSREKLYEFYYGRIIIH
ncbi:hypothetical protein ACLBO7_30445, partial [Klebsiella pneumoniae]